MNLAYSEDNAYLAGEMVKKAIRRLAVNPNTIYFCMRINTLKLVPTYDIQTMATDGVHLLYNPDWILNQTMDELEFTNAHEVVHVDSFHMTRKGDRDHEIWNMACDLAINPALVKIGLKMPEGGLLDWSYENMSAEQIYAKLKKLDDAGELQRPSGPVAGEVLPAPEGEGEGEGGGTSVEIAKAMEREIAAQMHQAKTIADKIAGRGNFAVDKLIDGIGASTVSWSEELKALFTNFNCAENTFARPNRRLLSTGWILPTPRREPTGELVIAIDCSFSMFTAEELKVIASELQDIADSVMPKKIVVIYCHEVVCGVSEFERGDEIKLHVPESGGTEFNPPFNYVHSKDLDPCAMIYFTDGWGDVGPDARHNFYEPDFPVIWATTGRAPFFRGCEPFGEVIMLDPENI
tara:strand:+ start:133 stop:1350 length:1218 start_codon:yes stop_codon:yes gene_type:complete